MEEENRIQGYPVPKSGEMPFGLTNDYLFRAVFQECQKALEGLCRAVLHLEQEDEIEVVLNNPIELGREIEEKEYVLDLAVTINRNRFVNLEMQAYYDAYWKERALTYTCRSYDNLDKGDDYSDVMPVQQVGFLKYTLFPEAPSFCSDYKLVNITKLEETRKELLNAIENGENTEKLLYTVKNGMIPQIFSDKLTISVVNLTKTDLATEEDKKYNIDLWAKVFTAERWEEIQMLAQGNEYIEKAIVTVAKLTEEEQIRMRCQARKDFEFWERMRKAHYEKEIKTRDEEILVKDKEIENLQLQIAELQQKLDEKK